MKTFLACFLACSIALATHTYWQQEYYFNDKGEFYRNFRLLVRGIILDVLEENRVKFATCKNIQHEGVICFDVE